MPTIGMIGNNAGGMARAFIRLCPAGGYRLMPLSMSKILLSNEAGRPVHVQVWAALDAPDELAVVLPSLIPEDYLLVNADCRDIFPVFARARARLITFGFSGKACVTASSVLEGALQVCVQRVISTMSGLLCEPQEFPADCLSDDIGAALGAATAGIVCEAIDRPVSK